MRDDEEVYHRDLPKLDDVVPEAKPIQPTRSKESVEQFYNNLKQEHPHIASQIGNRQSHRRLKYLFVTDLDANLGFMRFTIWDKRSCKVYIADGKGEERSRQNWDYRKAIVSLKLKPLDISSDSDLETRCLAMLKDYSHLELETYFKHRNYCLGVK